ncbi:MAG: hypothetical protein WC770_06620 [Phycisphaerae bacterium]|jgi:hypothetical protein
MPNKPAKPSLEHLARLTDETGLIQHAKFIIPDRFNGYCTDDNARAAIAMVKYLKKYPAEPQGPKLFEIYLSFLYHALKADKTVHNFMDYSRNWKSDEPVGDALGRTIWAFGSIIASPPDNAYVPVVREFFEDASNHIPQMSPRGMAYSILGQVECLARFPDAKETKETLAFAADRLVEHYKKHSTADWNWFEDILSYDNAILPAALFAAASALNDKTTSKNVIARSPSGTTKQSDCHSGESRNLHTATAWAKSPPYKRDCHAPKGLAMTSSISEDTHKYLEVAEKTCKFLLDNIYNGTHFSFIGAVGWYPKGKTRAQFDQQPIEVASTVLMLKAAYEATGDKEYLSLQKKAFDWFFGENDLRMAVYDSKTNGCCDGIGDGGVNINQGAESIVSFLLALLTLSQN